MEGLTPDVASKIATKIGLEPGTEMHKVKDLIPRKNAPVMTSMTIVFFCWVCGLGGGGPCQPFIQVLYRH